MSDKTRTTAGPGMCRMAMTVFAVAILLCTLTGCGYRPAASAGNRLDSNHRLWVAFIANETISSTAQTIVRRALLEEAHTMRGIAPAGSFEAADLQVSGTLRSYSIGALSYTAADQAWEYRLTIEVELELRSPLDKSLAWKGTLRASQDYPVNSDLALQHSAEETALKAASHKLAQKFFTTLEQSY
jgi:outer membrane lipopolysaccharide assembly protein LptE/RlpB